jgi:uncharacterized protein
MPKLLALFGVLLLLYLGLCLLLFLAQRKLLYFPVNGGDAAAERLTIRSGDVDLTVWKLAGSGPDALLYFGGNAEAVQANVEDFRRHLPAYSVYLVCYRGYCGTRGQPTETHLLADALAVHDAIRPGHRHLALMGRSLGSAVAIHVAAERPVERLVLVTPFDSIAEVAASHYPIFPVRWLMKDRYAAIDRAPQLRTPILALIAERDVVIPRARTDALLAALPPDRLEAVTLARTGHNDLHLVPDYYAAIATFLSGDEAMMDELILRN